MTEATEKLRHDLERRACQRNAAYDRHGMNNTAESVDPLSYAVLVEAEASEARIAELEQREVVTLPSLDALSINLDYREGYSEGRLQGYAEAQREAVTDEQLRMWLRSCEDHGLWRTADEIRAALQDTPKGTTKEQQ